MFNLLVNQQNYFPGPIRLIDYEEGTRAQRVNLSFLGGLRKVKLDVNPKSAFQKLAESSNNTLLKNFSTSTSISKTSVGNVKFDKFASDMRSGNVSTALTAANPKFAPIATDSNVFVQSLKREANLLPDSNLAKKATVKGEMDQAFPQLKNITSEKELADAAAANPKLQKMLSDLDAKSVQSSAGGVTVKKLFFIGGAILITTTLLAALEEHRKTLIGCFLYTKDLVTGQITKCKISNASCSEPAASGQTKTCSDDLLPDFYKKNNPCKGNTSAKCLACNVNADPDSEEYVDPAELGDNQTVECVKDASMLEALSDIGSSMGWLGSKASGSVTGYLSTAMTVIMIVVGLVIAWNVYKQFAGSSSRRNVSGDARTLENMLGAGMSVAAANAASMMNSGAIQAQQSLNANALASHQNLASGSLAAQQNFASAALSSQMGSSAIQNINSAVLKLAADQAMALAELNAAKLRAIENLDERTGSVFQTISEKFKAQGDEISAQIRRVADEASASIKSQTTRLVERGEKLQEQLASTAEAERLRLSSLTSAERNERYERERNLPLTREDLREMINDQKLTHIYNVASSMVPAGAMVPASSMVPAGAMVPASSMVPAGARSGTQAMTRLPLAFT